MEKGKNTMCEAMIEKVVKEAINGRELTAAEISQLFQLPSLSAESFYIQCAARKMSETASQGLAEIHGQVGVNTAPCPVNCEFCSFAAMNGIFQEAKATPVPEVVANCLLLESAGANAIYLMTTANFNFADFLAVGQAVRQKLQPETVLVANIGDFNEAQARQLKENGFAGVYHAVRMGEGQATAVKVEKRLQTFRAAQKAGLILGTCVEPIGPEHSAAELVEKTLITREAKPCFSGAMRRIPIPGTPLSQHGMVSEAKMAHHLAVVRLAMGNQVIGNCTHEPNVIGAAAGANIMWAEVGANPRDTAEDTAGHRGFTVAKCREIYREAEWPVLSGPSKMFRYAAGGE